MGTLPASPYAPFGGATDLPQSWICERAFCVRSVDRKEDFSDDRDERVGPLNRDEVAGVCDLDESAVSE